MVNVVKCLSYNSYILYNEHVLQIGLPYILLNM